MKIRILDISDSLISFRSESGEGYAKWSGEKPLLNHNYDVELDIDDEFIWGQNITNVDATSTSMQGDGQNITAVAEIVSYYEDGCLSVKLSESVMGAFPISDKLNLCKPYFQGIFKFIIV